MIPPVIFQASKEALIPYTSLSHVHNLAAGIEKDIDANLIAKIYCY